MYKNAAECIESSAEFRQRATNVCVRACGFVGARAELRCSQGGRRCRTAAKAMQTSEVWRDDGWTLVQAGELVKLHSERAGRTSASAERPGRRPSGDSGLAVHSDALRCRVAGLAEAR